MCSSDLNGNANFVRIHDKNNLCGYVAKTSVEHIHAKTSASIVPLTTNSSIASLPTRANTTSKKSIDDSIVA